MQPRLLVAGLVAMQSDPRTIKPALHGSKPNHSQLRNHAARQSTHPTVRIDNSGTVQAAPWSPLPHADCVPPSVFAMMDLGGFNAKRRVRPSTLPQNFRRLFCSSVANRAWMHNSISPAQKGGLSGGGRVREGKSGRLQLRGCARRRNTSLSQ